MYHNRDAAKQRAISAEVAGVLAVLRLREPRLTVRFGRETSCVEEIVSSKRTRIAAPLRSGVRDKHLSFVISCPHQACLYRRCRLQVLVYEQGRRHYPSTLGVDPIPG